MTNQPNGQSRVATPDRFQVRCGIPEGSNAPFVEIKDNLAVQEIMMDLDTALLVASQVNQAAVAILRQVRQQAQAKRRGIVRADGSLMA